MHAALFKDFVKNTDSIRKFITTICCFHSQFVTGVPSRGRLASELRHGGGSSQSI